MSLLDKVRKFKQSHPKNDGRTQTRGIFHDWNDGENIVRFVGSFLEVKTHFVAGVPKRRERGLCQDAAFDRDNSNRISKVVNCPDWDIDTETDTGKKTCPICKLNQLARQALKEGPNEEEEKYFKGLMSLTRPRSVLKWHVFDREDPNVTMIDENGKETKKKGLKIASVGMEAWDDIMGIFDQCGFDITDAQEGVDICVKKGHNGMRVEYSAQVCLDGKGLKCTPFDEEEQALADSAPDLKPICGKKTEASAILEGLHGDYRELLDLNEEEDAAPAPAAKKASKSKVEEPEDEDEDDAEDVVDEEDEDDVFADTDAKKKGK